LILSIVIYCQKIASFLKLKRKEKTKEKKLKKKFFSICKSQRTDALAYFHWLVGVQAPIGVWKKEENKGKKSARIKKKIKKIWFSYSSVYSHYEFFHNGQYVLLAHPI